MTSFSSIENVGNFNLCLFIQNYARLDLSLDLSISLSLSLYHCLYAFAKDLYDNASFGYDNTDNVKHYLPRLIN